MLCRAWCGVEVLLYTYIFTCNPKSGQEAVRELSDNDGTFDFIAWLDDGVGAFRTALDNDALCDLIKSVPVIFTRHVHKVDAVSSPHDFLDALLAFCRQNLDKSASFTVQVRSAGKTAGAFSGGIESVADEVAGALVREGFSLDVAGGKSIISVFIDGEKVWWGIGNAALNLSHWKGGASHYSHTSQYDFISRAEYKLVEAIECFGIDMADMKSGADLGAAPGGWTKVLLDHGLAVTSIDPALLRPEIEHNAKVRYFRMQVEEYLRQNDTCQFDVVVNDMRMDVGKSIGIINQFYGRIKNGGIVIVTFKLPHECAYSSIKKWLAAFNGFALIGARQLFHNRSEITVALRKRADLRSEVARDDVRPKKNVHGMSKKLERKMSRRRKIRR